MKYIIMADGEGKRWKNYNGLPKHLIPVDGEPIIKRTIDQIRSIDDRGDIIITSHNESYEFEGAKRYEPESNHLEIDRFTEELIEKIIYAFSMEIHITRIDVFAAYRKKTAAS